MRLSRRHLLTGHSSHMCHIASMVVQCLPEKLDSVARALADISTVEVPERDERGKLVIVIEAEGEASLMASISKIESTAGVISANMVYHQIDE